MDTRYDSRTTRYSTEPASTQQRKLDAPSWSLGAVLTTSSSSERMCPCSRSARAKRAPICNNIDVR
jgi:hypothetical protein